MDVVEEEDELEDVLMLVVLCAGIVHYNSIRNRSKLTRSALLQPSLSPWNRLYMFGDESSFLEMTGFTRFAFNRLRQIVFPPQNADRKGRPRSLDDNGELGLYLLYLGSQMKTKHLCTIFGTVPTTTEVTINKVMRMVCRSLKRNRIAEIKFPDKDKMSEFARMVEHREPMVKNVIGFVDGVSVPVQCSDEEHLQRAAYCGYSHDTMCNNVFAFSPEGKIIYAAINFPGSWHDSTVSLQLIRLVVSKIGTYALCVDQGFPRSGDLFDRFVGPLPKRLKRRLTDEARAYLLPLHEKYISLRQASEWGMRALQGTFSRLKSRLTSNLRKREKIILSIVLLYNFRTELVGLNQIATVFNRHYEQYINLDTYDRIHRYFIN